jgi:hypothetical protein
MPDDNNNTGGTGGQASTGNAGAGAQTGAAGTWTPPTQAEWEAVKKASADGAEALKQANAEAATRRRQAAEAAKAHETEAETAKREAAEAATAATLPLLLKAEAKAAFLAEGADKAKVAKLTRLLDLDKVKVTGGDVTGLDEQVAEIKADFPELFGKAEAEETGGRKPGRMEVGGRKPDGTPLSPIEMLTAQMTGRK